VSVTEVDLRRLGGIVLGELFHPDIADAKGCTYDESSRGAFEQGFFSPLQSLNPDVSKRGDVAFDVPPDRQYVLVLSGGFESSKQVYVSLPRSTSDGQQP
jgi:hypothetical protein